MIDGTMLLQGKWVTAQECTENFDRPFVRIPDPEKAVDEEEPKKQAAAAKPKYTSKLDELMRTALKQKGQKHDDDDDEDDEDEEDEKDETTADDLAAEYRPLYVKKDKVVITDDELWRKTFAKYYRFPTTELEKVRERHFRSMEREAPETAQNEDEMQEFREYRWGMNYLLS